MSPGSSMIEMDFAVISEDYSRYTVQDGSILKVKIVVRKIHRSAEKNAQGYPDAFGIDSMNAIAAIVPPTLKRSPTVGPIDLRVEVGQEMKFDPQEEKWQEYITNEGYKVLVKPVVTKVIRYNKFNEYGEPIYSANVQAITNVEKFTTTG